MLAARLGRLDDAFAAELGASTAEILDGTSEKVVQRIAAFLYVSTSPMAAVTEAAVREQLGEDPDPEAVRRAVNDILDRVEETMAGGESAD